MPRVPTGVKVVSILGIIYAGIWLLFMPCGLFSQFHPLMPDPAMDTLNNDSVFLVNYFVSMVIWTGLMGWLLTGSIGSLKLKTWGRKSMVRSAWAHVVYGVCAMALSFVIIVPRMIAAYEADPTKASVMPILKATMFGSAILSLAFYAAVSGVIIFFFTRKVAVDAFNGIFHLEETSFPVVMPEDRPL